MSGVVPASAPPILVPLSSPPATVRIDPSPGTVGVLAKGSTKGPAKNLDSGRRRRGVVLPLDDRNLRRRKKRTTSAHSASRPTAPAAAPPTMAPTLIFEELEVDKLLLPDEGLDVAPTAADVDVLLVNEDTMAGGVAVEEVWFDVAVVLCDDCEVAETVVEGLEEP